MKESLLVQVPATLTNPDEHVPSGKGEPLQPPVM
jgi:hypothetical protein